jgi:hypothetical protein
MVHGFRHVSVAGSDRSERGAVAIVVALLMMVFLGFASLIVDLGNARQLRRQAQGGADAAALAGAQELLAAPPPAAPPWAGVISQVEDYAQQDMGTPLSAWVGCVDPQALPYAPDVTNTDTCISSDSSTLPTRIRVQLPLRAVPTIFGGVLGVTTTYVAAAATAEVNPTVACVLCVLSPTGTALSGNGEGVISITGGGLVVDSTGPVASYLSGNSLAVSTGTGAGIGGPDAPQGFILASGASYTPTPVEEPPVPDPLSTIPECPAAGSVCPTTTFPNVNVSGAALATLTPGIYNTISVTNGASLTMAPGTYIITGSFTMSGLGTLTAAGVTLYFACSSYPAPCAPGQSGASMLLAGNGALSLSPPTSGPFQGMTVFFDRNNTATASITGNGGAIMTGTIYMASGALSVTGNGSLASALNSMIVASTVTVGGNGEIDIKYVSTGQNVPIGSIQLSQ